jgi:hypothetical protein
LRARIALLAALAALALRSGWTCRAGLALDPEIAARQDSAGVHVEIGRACARPHASVQGLDIRGRKRHPCRRPKDLQQHRNPLMRGHAGIDRQKSFKRTGQYPYAITTLQHPLGKFDYPIVLTAANFLNDGLRHLCRLQAVHHQANDARAPTGSVPLQLDEQEGVPGEKRALILLLATSAHGTPFAQAWRIDLKIGAREQIEPLAARLQLIAIGVERLIANHLHLAIFFYLLYDKIHREDILRHHRPISPRPPLPMTATVVLGYAKVGIERRPEERPLRHLDRAVHIAIADHGTRAQLFGNELEIAFDILPRQRRGGGHHGGKLSIR